MQRSAERFAARVDLVEREPLVLVRVLDGAGGEQGPVPEAWFVPAVREPGGPDVLDRVDGLVVGRYEFWPDSYRPRKSASVGNPALLGRGQESQG